MISSVGILGLMMLWLLFSLVMGGLWSIVIGMFKNPNTIVFITLISLILALPLTILIVISIVVDRLISKKYETKDKGEVRRSKEIL